MIDHEQKMKWERGIESAHLRVKWLQRQLLLPRMHSGTSAVKRFFDPNACTNKFDECFGPLSCISTDF